MDPDGIGGRLKSLRHLNNMSQDAVAQRLGFSRSCIRNWELGTTRPSLEDVCLLASLFHVTTDYLLGMDGNRSIQLNFLSDQAYEAVVNMFKVLETEPSRPNLENSIEW